MTTLAVTVGAYSQTAYLIEGSSSLKFNTFDATLIDPTHVPAIGDAVALTTPTWAGTVSRVKRYPGPRIGHKYVTFTATNTDTAGASAGPFGLSDTPNNSTTYGYDSLEVETTHNLDGTDVTRGSCTIYHTGLWPAMTFLLTCADLGYSAANFSVTDVTVTWVKGVPRYAMTFGDPLVTMSVWLNSESAGILPITRTKITDGEVTTPKLEANAVTADKIAAGAVEASKLLVGDLGNTITNPGFETGDLTGWTGVPASGGYTTVGTTAPHGGKYNANLINGGTAYSYIIGNDYTPTAAGETVTLSVYAKAAASTPTVSLLIYAYDSAKAYLGVVYQNFALTTGWQHCVAPLVMPASTAFARPILQNNTASSTVYVDDAVLERGSVVIDTGGITITNGALTLTNPGGTVIIDGTSNMFKIAATGTISQTVAAWTSGAPLGVVTNATLTGLGTLSATKAMHGWFALTNTNTGPRVPDNWSFPDNATGYVASTSAGSPTTPVLRSLIQLNWASYLDGSGYEIVQFLIWSVYAISSLTYYGKYYVLQETAL